MTQGCRFSKTAPEMVGQASVPAGPRRPARQRPPYSRQTVFIVRESLEVMARIPRLSGRAAARPYALGSFS